MAQEVPRMQKEELKEKLDDPFLPSGRTFRFALFIVSGGNRGD
jgi:hypothetical protein